VIHDHAGTRPCGDMALSPHDLLHTTPGRVARYCDRRVCRSAASISPQLLMQTSPNFCTCCLWSCLGASVLIDRVPICHLHPVLWMTSRFPVVVPNREFEGLFVEELCHFAMLVYIAKDEEPDYMAWAWTAGESHRAVSSASS